MNEDLESNDVIEAYNRLSLLLEEQNRQKPQSDNEISPNIAANIKIINDQENIENKINILTNIIEKPQEKFHKSLQMDHLEVLGKIAKPHKSLQNEQLFSPIKENLSHSSSKNRFFKDSEEINEDERNSDLFEKNYTSKNVLPHMDDLITVLTNNDVLTAKEDLNQPLFNNISTENNHNHLNGQKTHKQQKIHSYKKTKYDAFAIYKVFFIKFLTKLLLFTKKKKASPDEINETLNRFSILEKVKQEKIENLKKEQEEYELKQIKATPSINKSIPYSNFQRTKPIHLRTNEILSARKEKQKRLVNQIQLEKEARDPSPNYKPDLALTHHRNYSSARKKRSTSEFLKAVEGWYNKKNEKIQVSQITMMNKEMKKMPFHPKINNKWQNINIREEYDSIEERLLEAGKTYKEKEKKMIEKSTPTFVPKINKNSQKIIEDKNERIVRKKFTNEYSSERKKPRPSFLDNTISFSIKGNEKFVKSVDEKDLRYSLMRNRENSGENQKASKKINLVEFSESNKFVIEMLKNKKHGKLLMKINERDS